MRKFDENDQEEIKKLNPEPWMLEQLKLNPSYVWWGPHEDYMYKENKGWESRSLFKKWGEGFTELDELNEVVNFYFSIERDYNKCKCEGTGYSPQALTLNKGFYNGWENHLTIDETEALIQNNRSPIPDQILGYDDIIRSILVKARCKRLGYEYICAICNGDGIIYTSPTARLSLTLWVLHPRKGASRGVEFADIKQDELPSVYAFLKQAAARNAERFSKIP